MRRTFRAALLAAVVVVAACGGGGTDATSPYGGGNTGGNTGGNNNGSTSSSITVGDNYFDPNSTTVKVGTTVTWTFGTGTTHNVTFDDGTQSGDKSAGTYTRTFNSAGTFNYRCTIHGGMNGTIIVQ
jgi:plastocyanin